jgi:hypothetical protein
VPTPRRWRRWRFHGSSAYHPDGLTDRVLELEGVMGTTDATFTAADLRLIEEDYRTLDELCAERGIDPAGVEAMIASGLMPQPAYILPDGRQMFPEDYFQLYDDAGSVDLLQGHFRDRFVEAARRAGLEFTDEWNPDSEWTDYVDGTYWVCLYNATPEVMIEKERQIRAISEAMDAPDLESGQWRERLRAAVRALDSIELPFTDFARARWDYTSRERYIAAVEKRWPEVFEPEM